MHDASGLFNSRVSRREGEDFGEVITGGCRGVAGMHGG